MAKSLSESLAKAMRSDVENSLLKTFRPSVEELEALNKSLTLERGHIRHRLQSLQKWAEAKDTLDSSKVLELLNAPIPTTTPIDG